MIKRTFDFERILEWVHLDLSILYSRSVAKKLRRVGEHIRLTYPSTVVGHDCIEIGENFSSMGGLRLEAIKEYRGQRFSPEIIIGRNVRIHDNVHIGCTGKITIGDDSLLAGRITITDHQHGELDAMYDVLIKHTDQPLSSKGVVIIEENCWIGDGVVILPGARIGRGSIVGANAVVRGDIPPFSIAVGVPASVVKRFNFKSSLWE